MTLTERAKRYVETLPCAVSGSRGHDALLRVACVLTHGFGLSDPEAKGILIEYSGRCLPPWTGRELDHKLTESRKITHREPFAYLAGNGRNLHNAAHTVLRIIGRIALPEIGSPMGNPEPVETPEPTAEDAEAERIAGELAKMHKAGHLIGPDDPNAELMAGALKLFKGKYIGGIAR